LHGLRPWLRELASGGSLAPVGTARGLLEALVFLLACVAWAAAIWRLGLPRHLFSFFILPLPVLAAVRWPLSALVLAMLGVFSLGSALAVLLTGGWSMRGRSSCRRSAAASAS
jgi:hypothetical protein